MSTPDSPLIFLHITKTAGGTLRRALDGQDDLSVHFAYTSEPEDVDYRSFDIIYGHQIYGFHEKHGLTERYAAVVRHPLARCISHYYHLRNDDPGHIGDRIRQSTDINHFFATMEHWEFDNLMCRVLSGDGHQIVDMADTRQRAIANLSRFEYVGVQEFFPYVASDLNSLLGCELPSVANVNVGAYDRAEVSNETIEKIQALNKHDEILYWAALRQFADTRLSSSGTVAGGPAVVPPPEPETYSGIRRVFLIPGVKNAYSEIRKRIPSIA